jgi:hypothetical protein
VNTVSIPLKSPQWVTVVVEVKCERLWLSPADPEAFCVP